MSRLPYPHKMRSIRSCQARKKITIFRSVPDYASELVQSESAFKKFDPCTPPVHFYGPATPLPVEIR